jgi:hypothetical protein
MSLRSQRGSTLVEAVLAAPLIGMVIVACAVLIYLSFAKVWMNRAAREAAVCLASPSPPSRCRARLTNTLRLGLPIGRIEIREFQNTRYQTRVSLQLSFERVSTMQDSTSTSITAASSFQKPRFFPLGE